MGLLRDDLLVYSYGNHTISEKEKEPDPAYSPNGTHEQRVVSDETTT